MGNQLSAFRNAEETRGKILYADQMPQRIRVRRELIPLGKRLNTITRQSNMSCDVKLVIANHADVLNPARKLNTADALNPIQIALPPKKGPRSNDKSNTQCNQRDFFLGRMGGA